jgi:LPXTG-motif cell wall-anchored protein
MSGSREILKKLVPETGGNITYLIGGAGLLGAMFLLYYYRKPSRPGFEQKTTFSPKSGKVAIEEKFVHTTVSEARDNEVKNGGIDNRSIGPHAKTSAVGNKITDGDLSNAPIHYEGSLTSEGLQNVLQQTGLRSRQPTTTNVTEKPTEPSSTPRPR